MKRILLVFSFVLTLMVGTHVTPVMAQVETGAEQAIIIDAGTGVILLDKNADQRMPTSSMSKVMTIYMVFEALKEGRVQLTDRILISEKAWKMGGSKMFIKVGDQVKIEDLVRGVIVQSGNDAAVALSEGLGGTEEAFVDTMNVRAQELGMKDSHFMNASGWPAEDHYSSPRDLATLAYRVIHDFPEYYHYFSETEFTYNKIRQPNRDPLLGTVRGADGLKTGHTEVAGYGLMGSAMRDGRRVIMVLNGMASKQERKNEGIRLLEWGFNSFEKKTIVTANVELERAPVWLGQKVDVPLVIEKDVDILLPRAKSNQAFVKAKYDSPLKAPIKKGDPVGMLTVTVPDQKPITVQLVAGQSVLQKGLFGRVIDRFKYLLMGTI